ncbi:MAG: glycosyltransferase family 39 protein, partial [Candidatus Nanoarchaeia archaeon]
MKKYEYLILAVLFGYGFVLRIYSLGFQSLWIDESFSINASLAVLRHFYPLLESGFFYSGYLLHTYLLSGMFFLFGVSEFTARLPSVVFGSLFIVLVYLFVRYLFNARVAIFSSILVAFSTLEIAWSRQARSYVMLQFVFFLSLFLFLYFVRTKNLKWFYYSLIVAFIGFFVHPFSLFLFVIYFVYGIVNFKFFSGVFNK